MRSGLCHTRLNTLDFFHDNDLGNLGQSPQNNALDSKHFFRIFVVLVWELPRMKTFLLYRKTSQMALEGRHKDVSHSRNDAQTPL
jgi:hypothetical protein